MRRTAAASVTLAGLATLVLLEGCAASNAQPAATASSSIAPVATTTSAAAPVRHRRVHRVRATVAPTATATATARSLAVATPFRWHSAPVTAAFLGRSWHSGCPVAPGALRALTLTFWGFDHRAHRGTLVVNASVRSAYVAAFRTMYAAHFPIRRMEPISTYGGSDNRSMAHDNTSAFNCRYAVSNGPKHWSMHAYGEAVDIDPLENPYELGGKVLPPAGAPYTDRRNARPGMIVPGSTPVRAFASLGWGWGGYWSDPDYQHFSTNGG